MANLAHKCLQCFNTQNINTFILTTSTNGQLTKLSRTHSQCFFTQKHKDCTVPLEIGDIIPFLELDRVGSGGGGGWPGRMFANESYLGLRRSVENTSKHLGRKESKAEVWIFIYLFIYLFYLFILFIYFFYYLFIYWFLYFIFLCWKLTGHDTSIPLR